MALKDYYAVLGVPPQATLAEIKSAYRRLAHKYHPDKNQEIPDAALVFREIQEAYTILANEPLRKSYDQQRYFAGITATARVAAIDSAWLSQEVKKLRKDIEGLDTGLIYHKALAARVLKILSSANIAILLNEKRQALIETLIKDVLVIIRSLEISYYSLVTERLKLIAFSQALHEQIEASLKERRKQAKWERVQPLLVLLIAITLCLLMYWYSS